MSRLINKRIFLAARTCPTQGWYAHQLRTDSSPSIAETMRMEWGQEIGRRARACYPEGILIEDPAIEQAATETARLLANPKTTVLFEATFIHEGYVTKADILLRSPTGWVLLEVKSSTNWKPELDDDLAYTTAVITRSGLVLDSLQLMLISPDYRLGQPAEDLFEYHDRTSEIAELVQECLEEMPSLSKLLVASAPPPPEWILACRQCEYFSEHCVGVGIENHILEIPRLHQTTFQRLRSQGITRIADIPEEISLSANQQRVCQSIRSNQPVVDHGVLKSLLSEVNWPAYYLDFESCATVLPIFAEHRPYQAIPTQYSVHVCSTFAEIIAHREYLADHQQDCRQELLERLLEDLGSEGSIIVYSSYESRILKELAIAFPEHATRINACLTRLYDLERVFKEAYCHPAFRGKTSIKYTLPALVGTSYKHLAIQNGDDATAAYAQLLLNRVPPERIEPLRRDLLDYCKQDTWAMVELHAAVASI